MDTGEGVPEFFSKNPRGVKAFRKICLGGPPVLGFIAFLLTSVMKFGRRGYYIYPPPSPHLTPICVHLCLYKK